MQINTNRSSGGTNMTHQPFVRRFLPSEWPIYKALRLQSLNDSPDAFGSTLDQELARTDAAWAERLQSAESSGQDCALLAELGGTPSGLVWAKVDSTDPRTVNIFQMWVAPQARARGVGEALLRAALQWATDYGAHEARLSVTCGDTPATRLYRRVGFVEFGDSEPIRPGSNLQARKMVLSLPGSAGAAD